MDKWNLIWVQCYTSKDLGMLPYCYAIACHYLFLILVGNLLVLQLLCMGEGHLR